MAEIKETKGWRVNGFLMLLLTLALMVFTVILVKDMIIAEDASLIWMAVFLLFAIGVAFSGFFVVQPNAARVLVFFGRYVGS
ncbi:MAG: Membrane protease, partial [Bacteroidetes bacterium]|nr:Membrane protease [Bacteroidota bacterium]